MDVLALYLLCSIVSITSANQRDNMCNACNCQFKNIEVLSQLIDAKLQTGSAGNKEFFVNINGHYTVTYPPMLKIQTLQLFRE